LGHYILAFRITKLSLKYCWSITLFPLKCCVLFLDVIFMPFLHKRKYILSNFLGIQSLVKESLRTKIMR